MGKIRRHDGMVGRRICKRIEHHSLHARQYAYEKLEMALHDRKVTRWFATGIVVYP